MHSPLVIAVALLGLTHGEMVMATLTAIYVGLTAVYVYISHKTLQAIKRQADLTEKQAESVPEQLRLAGESSQAAKDNAAAALLQAQTLVNSERPWISIQIVSSERQPGYFIFEAINYGRTPAEIVSYALRWNSIAMATDDVPETPDYGTAVIVHRPLVVPGQRWSCGELEFNLAHLMNHDEELAANIESSRRRFIFWGRITYVDILGEPRGDRPIRETRFCYWYNPLLHTLQVGGRPGYNQHT